MNNPFRLPTPRPGTAIFWGSKEQQDACNAGLSWFSSKRTPVFRLFGPAGSGKTTIAHTIAAQIDGQVMSATFSGKAASVMRQKGCAGASTIHSLIYKPEDDGIKVRFVRNAQRYLNSASLLFIEIWNVDAKLGRDLLSFKTTILVLGDAVAAP